MNRNQKLKVINKMTSNKINKMNKMDLKIWKIKMGLRQKMKSKIKVRLIKKTKKRQNLIQSPKKPNSIKKRMWKKCKHPANKLTEKYKKVKKFAQKII